MTTNPTENGVDNDHQQAHQLSHVGKAALKTLNEMHGQYRGKLWNLSSGSVVGSLQQTPRGAFQQQHFTTENCSGEEDWFPQSIAAIMKRTESFCDIMNLTLPDGDFLQAFQDAVDFLDQKQKPIVVRMMFGNFLFHSENICRFVKRITQNIDPNKTQLQLWVGTWRSYVSWQHAKVIAVDGKYLQTGGHNLWHKHYLAHSPAFDLSVEMEGSIATDGHCFANQQWQLLQKNQQEESEEKFEPFHPEWGYNARFTYTQLASFPSSNGSVVDNFPPQWNTTAMATNTKSGTLPKSPATQTLGRKVPTLSVGCYVGWRSRGCSDDAFVAMFAAAQSSIKMVIQDFGPPKWSGTNFTYESNQWPHDYFQALAEAIWNRGVTLEVVFSNLNSTPGGLSGLEGTYSNKWHIEDSAARILHAVRKYCQPSATDKQLLALLGDQIKFCYIRTERNGNQWEDGSYLALHSKHFIVDDTASYIGSQNMYKSRLCEWGVVVDDEQQTQQFLDEYWNPMFAASYQPGDCDFARVQSLMDDPEKHSRSLIKEEWRPIFNSIVNIYFWRPSPQLVRCLRWIIAILPVFIIAWWMGGREIWRGMSQRLVLVDCYSLHLFLACLLTVVLVTREFRLQKSQTCPPTVSRCKSDKSNHMDTICKQMADEGMFSAIKPSLFFGTNPLLATLAGFVIKGPRQHNKFLRFRELLKMHDKATVALDWELPPSEETTMSVKSIDGVEEQRKQKILEGPISQPVVLILHGIGNTTTTGYMRSLMRSCAKKGWIAVGMNHRGCSGPVTSPTGYTGAYTGDLRQVVGSIASRLTPGTPLLLVGHSIGANLMVKYLGEECRGGTLPAAVAGGVSLANPCDIRSDQWKFPITQALNVVAKKTLLQTALRFLPTIIKTMPSYRNALRSAFLSNSMEGFDSAIAPIMIRNDPQPPFSNKVGYASAQEYWDDAGSFRYASHIGVPTLQITSRDDFLVYKSSHDKLPFFQDNPNLLLMETKTGGHLGWYESLPGKLVPTSWAERATTTFLQALLQAKHEESAV